MELRYFVAFVSPLILVGLIFGIAILFVGEDNSEYTEQSSGQGDRKLDIQELEIKAYLVEKYNPGTIFGQPRPIDDREVQLTLGINSDLTRFLKDRFGATTDFQLYTKIQQFQNITLTKNDSGYDLILYDGRSCSAFAYKGRIEITGGKIFHEEIEKSHKSDPC